MNIKIHLAIYGLLTGLLIAVSSYAWNMKKVNELYLNTLQSSIAAGMGKCFLKGNNKPDCPQFEDEKEWMEKEGINDINNK